LEKISENLNNLILCKFLIDAAPAASRANRYVDAAFIRDDSTRHPYFRNHVGPRNGNIAFTIPAECRRAMPQNSDRGRATWLPQAGLSVRLSSL
jgi:hypothetical protein